MEFHTLLFLFLAAIIGAAIQFFFIRAIIISAIKQVFIDLQNANAAIRVVNVQDAVPLSHVSGEAINQPAATAEHRGRPVRTPDTLITSGGKVFQRNVKGNE